MDRQWKLICKLKDVPLDGGARLVPRGLAWQELPGVALFRTGEESVHAVLDCRGVDPRCSNARRYSVRVEGMKVYLDLEELSAPASQAEAALAGQAGVATSLVAQSLIMGGASAAGARRAASFRWFPSQCSRP